MIAAALVLRVGTRVSLLVLACQRFKLRVYLSKRSSRFGASNNSQRTRRPGSLSKIKWERKPCFGAVKTETRRHHPDDRKWLVVESYFLAQHILIAAEATLPECVADYQYPLTARPLLFRENCA